MLMGLMGSDTRVHRLAELCHPGESMTQLRRRKRCPWIFKLPYYPTHPENVSSSQWHGGHPSCEPAESLSPTRSFSDSQPLNSTPKPVVTPMAVLNRSGGP